MGTSTDGILVYGYDLGDSPKFAGLDEYETPQWFNDDETDFSSAAEERLLTEHGFTETDWRADGYFKRKEAAEKAMGVEIVHYCSDGCVMYLLAAKHFRASRGYVEVVDMALPGNADERLAWAVKVLGLQPEAEQAQWLLASWWG